MVYMKKWEKTNEMGVEKEGIMICNVVGGVGRGQVT